MAFIVVTSLLEIVEQQLLQPNQSLVLYNKEMIVSLSNKLFFLQDFLEETMKKTNDNQARKLLEARIRNVVVEAEGKIEYKIRQVYLAANRGESIVVACQEFNQTLKEVVKDIESLKTRILMHNAKYWRNWFINRGGEHRGKDSSQNSLEPEDEIIVGLDKDVKQIVQELTNLMPIQKVTTLVGEGGIGKTTLAKMIFEHAAITAHFKIRAWVVASKEHNLKEMLIGLLGCIVPMTSEVSNNDETQLAEQLCRSLIGRRYLIVLDDIWTITAWDAIQGCFPDNHNGSRILTTTRVSEVANFLSLYPYHLDFKTLDESFTLFLQKAFRNTFLSTPEQRSLGKQITKYCGGLPLAIVVMAGLLATVKGSLEIWKDVVKALARIDYRDDRISIILSLSYDYLPNHLKACFLYFGVFPEDSVIPVKKIIKLWVAEGFLKAEKNKSLEQVAENCLFDLINRNLVQINERSIDGKVKSCKIHDRLHDICIREANKENILCVTNENHASRSRRWISSQSRHWPITQASFGNHASEEIRSVLYFVKDSYLSNCKLAYPCLKLLRVLDLSLIKYLHTMPCGIADLIHLRYLALSTIGSLYKFRVFKLPNLQTLIVSSWMERCPLQLSCDIFNFPRLRHLQLQKRCSQYLPGIFLFHKNIQTLYWLKVSSLDQEPNFTMVPNLKELGIYVEGQLLPSCLEGLVQLGLLEKLKLEVGRVENFSLPNGFPPNLKKLTLCYTYLPWEQMDIIGTLPKLEVVKLKDFAFCGPDWAPSEGGFKALKVLLIARSDLRHWKASANHFPVLERLVLSYCWNLKQFPIALVTIITLKLIVLGNCYSSLKTSAEQIMRIRQVQVRDLGTKVELPSNEGSEEVPYYGRTRERFGVPIYESFEEEESVELSNNQSSEVNFDFSLLLSPESSDEERLNTLKNVSKMLKHKALKSSKKVLKALKR